METTRHGVRAALLGAMYLAPLHFCVADSPVVKMTPLHTGVCQIGKDHVLGPGSKYTSDERMPFVIYAFFVESSTGDKALVDLGPRSVAYCNQMFRQHGFFRDLGPDVPLRNRYPDDLVQPFGNVFDHIQARGIGPDEIDHIVFTHLHADHHGMHDATDGGAAQEFQNAMLYVSRKGWEDNLFRRIDGRWNSYVDFAFSDFLAQQQQKGRVSFDDDVEIMPGLRTLYLGGHSICSQAVIGNTPAGPAIICSDEVYLYQLLKEDIMPKIRTSEENYRAAIERLVALAQEQEGILIPQHDPIVWKAHTEAGDDWLYELKKASDQAIQQYRLHAASR